jgi:hypothetical protein
VADIAAVVLLALDVLVVAFVVTLLLRVVVRAVQRYRRRNRVPAYAVRRCDACRMSWQAEPGVDHGRVELLLRRRERRRARGAARPAKGWAKARGWNRCPSCLSTRVRTSGDGSRTEEVDTRLSLEAVGYLATATGASLLAVAAFGFATRA